MPAVKYSKTGKTSHAVPSGYCGCVPEPAQCMFHAVYSINIFFFYIKGLLPVPCRRFTEIKLPRLDRHLQAIATKTFTVVEKKGFEGGLKAKSGEKSDKGGFPSTNFKLKCGSPKIQDNNGPLLP